MKKIIISIVLCLALMLPVMASADSDISVEINGVKLETPVAPRIVDGRTMLPMRAIFEALGAQVMWVQDGRMIFATKGDCIVVMQVDNTLMYIRKSADEDNQSITLEVAPFIENDRTLVPVRAVAEAFDAKVDWDNETRIAKIKTEN